MADFESLTKIRRALPAFYLGINGLLYCVLAALFVLEPIVWFGRLGITLVAPLGYTELKTMYIGLMGAMGVYFLLAASQQSLRVGALLFAAISYSLLALVRSYGIFIDGVFDDFTYSLLYSEIAGLFLGWLSVYCLLRPIPVAS